MGRDLSPPTSVRIDDHHSLAERLVVLPRPINLPPLIYHLSYFFSPRRSRIRPNTKVYPLNRRRSRRRRRLRIRASINVCGGGGFVPRFSRSVGNARERGWWPSALLGGRRGAKGGRHTAGRSPAVARRPTSTTSQPSPFQPPEHAGETGDSAALRSAGATCLAVGPYAPPPPSPPLPTVARCTPRWLDLASELPPVLLPSAPPMRLSRPTENRTRALPPLLLLLLPSTRPRPSFREQRTRVPTPRFATRRHLAASASRRAAKDNPE